MQSNGVAYECPARQEKRVLLQQCDFKKPCIICITSCVFIGSNVSKYDSNRQRDTSQLPVSSLGENTVFNSNWKSDFGLLETKLIVPIGKYNKFGSIW